MKKSIAKRDLLFSVKGETSKNKMTILVGEPYSVDESMVNFKFDPGASGCRVEFAGLPEVFIEEVYGADAIQALSFAIDVDPFLKRLNEKYDFYWLDGAGYFEE